MTSRYAAILSLVPDAKFSITDDSYESVVWFDTRNKPSSTEVNDEVTRLTAAEPMRLLRKERDKLLSETDWVSTKSVDTGVAVATNWKTYRQALRDLPGSSTPILDNTKSVGISSVTWPSKPS